MLKAMSGRLSSWRPVSLAALLFAAAACTDPTTAPESVRLTTGKAEYLAGDIVAVAVTNTTSRDFGYGACPLYNVDKQTNGSWQEVYAAPPPAFCIMPLYLLRPGDERQIDVRLPTNLAAAEYRLRLTDFPGAATNAFRVR